MVSFLRRLVNRYRRGYFDMGMGGGIVTNTDAANKDYYSASGTLSLGELSSGIKINVVGYKYL